MLTPEKFDHEHNARVAIPAVRDVLPYETECHFVSSPAEALGDPGQPLFQATLRLREKRQ